MGPFSEAELDRTFGSKYEETHFPKDHTGVEVVVRFYSCGCRAFRVDAAASWYFEEAGTNCRLALHARRVLADLSRRDARNGNN